MTASFPNSIANFSPKRNLFDDVDAADINKIQDELVAVQVVLGALLNTVSEIESDVTELETEQVSDNLTEVAVQNKFASLKDQLAFLTAGKHVYAADLATTSSFAVAKTTKAAETTRPALVKFPKPPFVRDPNKMYNGTGLTARKSGFYIILGSAKYNLADSAGAANYGMYHAAIGVNDQWSRGMDRTQPVADNIWANVFLNPIVMGYFAAGTRFTLRTGQTSQITQQCAGAHLSAVWLRTRVLS